MGKKDSDPTPNPAHIPNKDIIQRLNFLYQASVYLTNLAHDVPPSTSLGIAKDEDEDEQEDNQVRNRDQNPNPNPNPKLKSESKQARRTSRLRTRTADELARAYVDTMATVGKKSLVKMDPSIKRTICQSCKAVLVPGVSVQIRVRRSSSHRHALVLRCARCGYGRRLPAPERKGWDGRGRWEDVAIPEESTPDDDDDDDSNDDKRRRKKKKKNSKSSPRRAYPPVPLSARRDAGHVVFCGTSERVDEVGEDGVFAV